MLSFSTTQPRPIPTSKSIKELSIKVDHVISPVVSPIYDYQSFLAKHPTWTTQGFPSLYDIGALEVILSRRFDAAQPEDQDGRQSHIILFHSTTKPGLYFLGLQRGEEITPSYDQPQALDNFYLIRETAIYVVITRNFEMFKDTLKSSRDPYRLLDEGYLSTLKKYYPRRNWFGSLKF
jgi:hypothetical protein